MAPVDAATDPRLRGDWHPQRTDDNPAGSTGQPRRLPLRDNGGPLPAGVREPELTSAQHTAAVAVLSFAAVDPPASTVRTLLDLWGGSWSLTTADVDAVVEHLTGGAR